MWILRFKPKSKFVTFWARMETFNFSNDQSIQLLIFNFLLQNCSQLENGEFHFWRYVIIHRKLCRTLDQTLKNKVNIAETSTSWRIGSLEGGNWYFLIAFDSKSAFHFLWKYVSILIRHWGYRNFAACKRHSLIFPREWGMTAGSKAALAFENRTRRQGRRLDRECKQVSSLILLKKVPSISSLV